jgi:hypothetical protein
LPTSAGLGAGVASCWRRCRRRRRPRCGPWRCRRAGATGRDQRSFRADAGGDSAELGGELFGRYACSFLPGARTRPKAAAADTPFPLPEILGLPGSMILGKSLSATTDPFPRRVVRPAALAGFARLWGNRRRDLPVVRAVRARKSCTKPSSRTTGSPRDFVDLRLSAALRDPGVRRLAIIAGSSVRPGLAANRRTANRPSWPRVATLRKHQGNIFGRTTGLRRARCTAFKEIAAIAPDVPTVFLADLHRRQIVAGERRDPSSCRSGLAKPRRHSGCCRRRQRIFVDHCPRPPSPGRLVAAPRTAVKADREETRFCRRMRQESVRRYS